MSPELTAALVMLLAPALVLLATLGVETLTVVGLAEAEPAR